MRSAFRTGDTTVGEEIAVEGEHHGSVYRAIERMFEMLVNAYERGLDLVLRHRFVTLMSFFATMALTGGR